jgi:hypothetical protein
LSVVTVRESEASDRSSPSSPHAGRPRTARVAAPARNSRRVPASLGVWQDGDDDGPIADAGIERDRHVREP